MTKFEQKKFSTPANSQAFRDNWDAVFADDAPRLVEDPLCAHCSGPRNPNPPWPRGFCSVECERAFYRALGDIP